MWGFLLPKTGDDDLDAQLRRFQPVITSALERIGLGEVRFEGSSDLRWHDRKLGALTAQDVVACTSIGGFLNLDRPDLDLYLDVARVPDEKFKDKAVKDLREYVCTATEVAGEPVTYERFRDALLDALREAGIALAPSDLTEGERRGLRKIGERVASDEQIRRVSSSRFRETAPSDTRVGFGNEKGRKLCRAGVALDDEGTVRAAMLAGDMHVSPPDTMDRVAGALVGAAADERAELRARIADVFEGEDVSQAGETMGVTTDDVLAAVEKAIADAG
ncbi:MAG: hypothetical protein U5R31_01040 [Acidimicrobiia bacterium]|nr:hypothetical protein [Acidimicrobiia bacterium]